MRAICSIVLTVAFLGIIMPFRFVAQQPNRPALSKQRVPLKPLPPPPENSHGHGPDSRTGNLPTAPARTTADNGNPHGIGLPLGIGVGALAGITIWTLAENSAHNVTDRLSKEGPQFPESLRMSDFQVTGLAKGGWPVVVDYDAQPGSYVLLTIVTQNAPPAEAVLTVPRSGRRLQVLSLPTDFGTVLKSASFSIKATASATDPTPRYLRIYGFGCGKKAVGSVAIDELQFSPGAITASQPETHFGFHTHTNFDKMKAEFMQVALVNNSIEGQLFDDKKIDRRVLEGETVNDQWNAKKAKPGQIQFRVRGWMTVHDGDGGDWVSAFSPDLVNKQ